jgi:hypothetical protein
MADVALTRSENGSVPALKPREQVCEHLRSLVQGHAARREDLAAELAEVDAELRAFQKALAALDPPPPSELPTRPAKATAKPRSRGVGPERLAEIERAIREIIRENPDGEVSQVDVRARTGYSSPVMTSAFHMLRDANVIRLARVAAPPGGGGRAKFFRLTRPGERGDATASVPPPRRVRSQPAVLPETRQHVVDIIRALQTRGEPVTLQTIKASGRCSRTTARTVINELMREGVLRDLARGRREGSRGKVPTEYALVEAPPVNTEDLVPPVDPAATEDAR